MKVHIYEQEGTYIPCYKREAPATTIKNSSLTISGGVVEQGRDHDSQVSGIASLAVVNGVQSSDISNSCQAEFAMFCLLRHIFYQLCMIDSGIDGIHTDILSGQTCGDGRKTTRQV